MTKWYDESIRVRLKGRMLGGAQTKNIPPGGMLGEELTGMHYQYKQYGYRSSVGSARPRSVACLGLNPLGLALAAPTEAVGLG